MNNYSLTIPINKDYIDKRVDFAIILCVIICLCFALLLSSEIIGIWMESISIVFISFSTLLLVLFASFLITKIGHNCCVMFMENRVIVNYCLFSKAVVLKEGEFIQIKKGIGGKSWLLTNSKRANIRAKAHVKAYPTLLEQIIEEVPYIIPG